jgi:hypothetical protein
MIFIQTVAVTAKYVCLCVCAFSNVVHEKEMRNEWEWKEKKIQQSMIMTTSL